MIVALGAGVAYLVLLGIALRGRTGHRPAEGWLIAYCAFSAALMGIHGLLLLNPGVGLPLPDQPLALMGFVMSVALTGGLTLGYLAHRGGWLIGWGILVVAWIGAMVAAWVMQAPAVFSQQGGLWRVFAAQTSLSFEILAFGWLLLALVLFLLVARAFLSESLPLYANRILFWYVVIPFLMLGDALAAWLSPPYNLVGYSVRLVGAIAAEYGVLTHRVVDLRDSARRVVSFTILTLATGALVLGGIIAALNVPVGDLPEVGRWLLAVGIALGVALIVQPVNRFIRWLLRRLIVRDRPDVAEAIRLYGQRLGSLIDLGEFANAAIRAADELLGARRGYLILATQQGPEVVLEVIGTDRAEGGKSGRIALTSPIYQHFLSTGRPLLQYDIDYQREYHAAPQSERSYFSSLEMDVYAPIVGDGRLIGILALGPKVNDDPYQPTESELLAALATQTVTALENARLVADLRALNAEISSLNEDLSASNERLARLDAVKSDFISIASHELRTPLTQIQGYADLLLEMSERNLLTPQQTIEITASLRQASQRMGEVIASMLDVSQIDVENMDLSFVETSLASIIKLAIEPYSDAIHQRNLTLVARGLRSLPPIYGDYKRLVQAFEAMITNAVKFTPDGGKINVSGEVYERDDQGQPKTVRIIIQDTGIGIDPQHHLLIFEKFYRIGPTALHSTGSTKFKGAGPGLGLPIAKGIIEGHGGRIWVESEGHNEEKLPGSAFHVVLPVRPATMGAHQRIQQLRESANEPGGTADSKAGNKR